MDAKLFLELLLLLTVANGAPILARIAFGPRLGAPCDLGLIFYDGRRLLGPTKTIRGVMAAVAATALAGATFGLPLGTGALFGLLAMAGDLLSSFIKRRLGLASSHRAIGLDQGLESLIPLLFFGPHFGLSGADLVTLVAAFFLLEVVLSRVLYWLHIRNKPL